MVVIVVVAAVVGGVKFEDRICMHFSFAIYWLLCVGSFVCLFVCVFVGYFCVLLCVCVRGCVCVCEPSEKM